MIHLKPKIVNHETDSSGKVVYVLEVTNEQTCRTKLTKLRYSEFRKVHEQLVSIVDKLKLHLILPEFPGRKFFGSTNKSEESIFERKKELNNVFTLSISTLSTCCQSRSCIVSTCSRSTTSLARRAKSKIPAKTTRSTSKSASTGSPSLIQVHFGRRRGHLLREAAGSQLP